MTELFEALLVFMIAIGFFFAGRLWELRRVLFWKIQWIHVEHALARLEGRVPREVNDIDRSQT